METVTVRVKRLPHFTGELPKYESLGASGMDVRAQIDQPVYIMPGQRNLVPTGLQVEIPSGFELQVRPRSGWALKNGLTLMNSPGTIDSDYRGEIKVILANLGTKPFVVHNQDRMGQLVLCPVYQVQWADVDHLSSTSRGEGGFGSTGVGDQRPTLK